MSKKDPKKIPSEQKIEETIQAVRIRLNKSFPRKIPPSLNVKIFVLVLLILIIITLSADMFWNLIHIPNPEPDSYRAFMLDSCSITGLSKCSLDVYGNQAILYYYSGSNILINVSFPPCQDYKLQNNKVNFHNCDFSFSNNQIIDIQYLNPRSNLMHHEDARIHKVFELTKIKLLSKHIWRNLKFWSTNSTKENSNAYK